MNNKVIAAFCEMAYGPKYPKLIWPPDMDLIKWGMLEAAMFKMEIDEK